MKRKTTLIILLLFLVSCESAIDINLNDTNNVSQTPFVSVINGLVTTFAGTPAFFGSTVDGTGTSAQFSSIRGMTICSNGILYALDGNSVRKITMSGEVTTMSLDYPELLIDTRGIDCAQNGDLYVTNPFAHNILKITQEGNTTVFAGSTDGVSGYINATRLNARFHRPEGIALDNSGNIYITEIEFGYFRIRKIAPSGEVTTLAGNHLSANIDGVGEDASFLYPRVIVYGGDGYLYIGERYGVRKINLSTREVTRIAGGNVSGYVDSSGDSARFDSITGMVIDKDKNLFVTDYGSQSIRKITPAGDVTTFAGSLTQVQGSNNGVKTGAYFCDPKSLALNSSGNLFVGNTTNNTIRKVEIYGNIEGDIETEGAHVACEIILI